MKSSYSISQLTETSQSAEGNRTPIASRRDSEKQLLSIWGFKTKKALTEKVKSILHNSPLGQLPPDDEKLMLGLLALHPDYEEKKGCGIAFIGIAYWQHLKTKGFYLQRVDGTEEDFSYKWCLNPPSQWSIFKDACHYAVIDQTKEFKRLSRKSEKGYWSETEGKWIPSNDVHVDHVYPFALLLRDWLKQAGLAYEDIQVINLGTINKLLDPLIEESWRKYHREHARLQILSSAANLAKSDSYTGGAV